MVNRNYARSCSNRMMILPVLFLLFIIKCITILWFCMMLYTNTSVIFRWEHGLFHMKICNIFNFYLVFFSSVGFWFRRMYVVYVTVVFLNISSNVFQLIRIFQQIRNLPMPWLLSLLIYCHFRKLKLCIFTVRSVKIVVVYIFQILKHWFTINY